MLSLLMASCLTVLATHPFYALLDEPGHHEEGGNRVCPPPAGYGVGKKPQEERKREIGAGKRLLRLRPERRAANGVCCMELSPGRQAA